MSDAPPPGPAGWSCPVCGLYPQVRGCEPGKCKSRFGEYVAAAGQPASAAELSDAEEAMKACVAALPDPFADAVAYYWSLPAVTEEGAMDPVKPVEHPAPRLRLVAVEPLEEFKEKDGVPIVPAWIALPGAKMPTMRAEKFALTVLLKAKIDTSDEMEALLREWKGYSGWIHGDCDCLYCRTMRVLGRIDAAAKVG